MSLRFKVIALIPILLILTSCQDALVGSKPNPQPVTPENVTDAEVVNETNTTTSEAVGELFIPRYGNLTLYFLDVIGDAVLVHYNEKSALVNSGYEEDSEKILKSIRNLGITKLDYIFATNTQLKNIGGMPYIILRAKPSVLVESGLPSSPIYKELFNNTTVIQNDKYFYIDDILLQVLVAYDSGQGFLEREDDNSLVVKVTYGNSNFLLMSDCGMECEEFIDVQADVIKIADNCDATSLAFLQRVNPEIAVVLTSSEDFCQNIINRFKYLNIPLYITSEKGDIFITTDGLDYDVGYKE